MKIKKIILPGLGLALATVVAFTSVNAAQAQGPADNARESLVQRIAERFGLNQEEVQSVFDEERAEHQQAMQARLEEKLGQAVTDGKITAEQKDAILAKHAEMQSKREALKDLSPEERKAKMQEFHQEMKTWAEENGIALSSFALGRRAKFGGGPRAKQE
ncbi:MAG: hypothetical protein PVJ09_05555 [Candidatus Woesebacteria bacterium]|jgi:hypothetical protein